KRLDPPSPARLAFEQLRDGRRAAARLTTRVAVRRPAVEPHAVHVLLDGASVRLRLDGPHPRGSDHDVIHVEARERHVIDYSEAGRQQGENRRRLQLARGALRRVPVAPGESPSPPGEGDPGDEDGDSQAGIVERRANDGPGQNRTVGPQRGRPPRHQTPRPAVVLLVDGCHAVEVEQGPYPLAGEPRSGSPPLLDAATAQTRRRLRGP